MSDLINKIDDHISECSQLRRDLEELGRLSHMLDCLKTARSLQLFDGDAGKDYMGYIRLDEGMRESVRVHLSARVDTLISNIETEAIKLHLKEG